MGKTEAMPHARTSLTSLAAPHSKRNWSSDHNKSSRGISEEGEGGGDGGGEMAPPSEGSNAWRRPRQGTVSDI